MSSRSKAPVFVVQTLAGPTLKPLAARLTVLAAATVSGYTGDMLLPLCYGYKIKR